MSVDVLTFGCRLNAFESEVIAREAERAGLVRYRRHQQLRGHRRGGGAGAAVDPPAEARAAGGAHRRHRLRGADRAGHVAEMAEVDRVVGNDDKMRGEAWRDARAAFDGFRHRATRSRGRRHHGGQRDGAASASTVSRPACRALRAGAERLRPPLHLLHHSFRPGQFALGADGGRGRAGRALVERGHAEIVLTGVDLTSYGADLPGTPKLGQLAERFCGMCRT